jgi:hypothetical protein
MAKLNWDKINKETRARHSGAEYFHNDLAKEINKEVKKVRRSGPSLRTITAWKEEWIRTGADRHSTFTQYKKKKIRQWKSEQKRRK